jgi:hypothetical protein
MTDRLHSFVVVLKHDTREDYAESTLNAIRMIKGVISVEPQIREARDIVAHSRVRRELLAKITDMVLKET